MVLLPFLLVQRLITRNWRNNMDYKEKYEAVLEQMRSFTPDERGLVLICPSDLFPELKISKDELTKQVLLEYLEGELKDKGNEAWDGNLHTKDIIDWVEKQETTQWDRRIVQGCIEDAITACITVYGEDSYTARWLRTLKLNNWRPTELQMDALEDAANNAVSSISTEALNSLFNDLKKL